MLGASDIPCVLLTGPEGAILQASIYNPRGNIFKTVCDPGARVTFLRPDQGWLQWNSRGQTGLSGSDAKADDNYLHLYHT